MADALTPPAEFPPTPTGAATYDAVPYRGQPFKQTHPAHLAALGRLLRVEVADPRTCRILELGCCDGGNLIPMAEELPGATFVGVDYSAVQIEMGRKIVSQLGLKNLDLSPRSILDLTPADGEFDYIICHGVFSWVPNDVRDKILEVCSKNLAPNGMAYISYNAYPGWHMRGIVREMMRYHALRFETPERQTQEARLILDFVSKSVVGRYAEAYAQFLKSEADMLKDLPDHYLYHEHLEEHSTPYYFKDFVALARQHGLDYLSESRLAAMTPLNFGEDTERALRAIATDVVELEQFMDFLRSRTFRETVLHHAGRMPSYSLQPGALHGLYVASLLRPTVTTLDLRPNISVTFESPTKYPVSSASPLVKAALFALAKSFPVAIEFDALIALANEHLTTSGIARGEPQRDVQGLGRVLLQLLTTTDAVELRASPSTCTVTPGDHPVGTPYGRLLSRDHTPLTTRRHELLALEDDGRRVLERLDGTRTIADVSRELSGTMDEARVTKAVESLARMALLIA